MHTVQCVQSNGRSRAEGATQRQREGNPKKEEDNENVRFDLEHSPASAAHTLNAVRPAAIERQCRDNALCYCCCFGSSSQLITRLCQLSEKKLAPFVWPSIKPLLLFYSVPVSFSVCSSTCYANGKSNRNGAKRERVKGGEKRIRLAIAEGEINKKGVSQLQYSVVDSKFEKSIGAVKTGVRQQQDWQACFDKRTLKKEETRTAVVCLLLICSV